MEAPASGASYAWAAANSAASHAEHLESRIYMLEQKIEHITNWSNDLADTLNKVLEGLANHVDYEIPDDFSVMED